MSKITYQTQETPFYKALQTEVEAYFATKNKEKIGNASLYIKGIIIFSLAVYLYVQLVFFTPMWWVAIPLAAVFGVSLALIGMNVMHDGCHGSYSNNRFLNAIAGYTLNLLGICTHFVLVCYDFVGLVDRFCALFFDTYWCHRRENET